MAGEDIDLIDVGIEPSWEDQIAGDALSSVSGAVEDHDESGKALNNLSTKNRSCDRCRQKKRKCDGNGVDVCSRCIARGKSSGCTYAERRQPATRLPPSSSSSTKPRQRAAHTRGIVRARGRGGTASPRSRSGVPSLKRCRFSASPATGLVGMEENVFLSDFFGCMGFLPLTSPSDVREAMVKIMTAPRPGRTPEEGDRSHVGADEVDALTPSDDSTRTTDDGHVPMDPSTCTFWCTVALGALVRGQPLESVEAYITKAERALASFPGAPTCELARAWTIIGYFHAFRGDLETFYGYMKRASAFLAGVVEDQAQDSLPVGFAELVEHGDTVRFFFGRAAKDEVASFCNEEVHATPMKEAATEYEIFRYVMQSARKFEQALYIKVCDHDVDVPERKEDAVTVTSSEHKETVQLTKTVGDKGSSSNASYQFERLEYVVDRPSIRSGIGGLLINGTLMFVKAFKGDVCGVSEKLTRAINVLERFPGVMRFTMGLHMAHIITAAVVATESPEMPRLYEKVKHAYNRMRPSGSVPIPPLEEWRGISCFCNHFYCRSMEGIIGSEDLTFSSSKVTDSRLDDDELDRFLPSRQSSTMSRIFSSSSPLLCQGIGCGVGQVSTSSQRCPRNSRASADAADVDVPTVAGNDPSHTTQEFLGTGYSPPDYGQDRSIRRDSGHVDPNTTRGVEAGEQGDDIHGDVRSSSSLNQRTVEVPTSRLGEQSEVHDRTGETLSAEDWRDVLRAVQPVENDYNR